MQLIRKSDFPIKANRRLALEKLKAVDAFRQIGGSHCWRNAWIAETVAEKPARESQGGNSGACDA
jgi:hypothetical protein